MWLADFGIDAEVLEQERSRLRDLIQEAIRTAEEAPAPDANDFVADVQDIGAPIWES
jgi:hypothetical protein